MAQLLAQHTALGPQAHPQSCLRRLKKEVTLGCRGMRGCFSRNGNRAHLAIEGSAGNTPGTGLVAPSRATPTAVLGTHSHLEATALQPPGPPPPKLTALQPPHRRPHCPLVWPPLTRGAQAMCCVPAARETGNLIYFHVGKQD